MFNTRSWSKIIEKTYDYKSRVFIHDGFELNYSQVVNEIGEYLVAPSFGDYVRINEEEVNCLTAFVKSNNDKSIKIKICPVSEHNKFGSIKPKPDGYIHEIGFDSYDVWYKERIRSNFRRKINQAIKNGLTTVITNEKKDLRAFWEMHASLRLNKFEEIPQPWSFFENMYDEYFEKDKGYVIKAIDNKKNLVGGALFLIDRNKAFYKFSASYLNALAIRPNNLVMDRLIHFLSGKSIKTLNLGFTGSADNYSGLRRFKLHAGASEYQRFIFKTPSFDLFDKTKIDRINEKVKLLISSNPSLEEVDTFSQKYYRYFI